jgi:iron-sulfur cluster repair protein YtfE (RIC family)
MNAIDMNTIDMDASVPDVVIDHPALLRLFEELGVEFTCGGKSLRTACLERGLNPIAVARQCEELLRGASEGP